LARSERRIDFSGLFPDWESYSSFNEDVVESLRKHGRACEGERVLVIDRGYGLDKDEVVVVRDHLNLTGASPLVGPNNTIGERFPVLDGIYLVSHNAGARSVITAGLKPGCNPSPDDIAKIKTLGAEAWCYNVVPTMIVAAHAGFKVCALLVSIEDASTREKVRGVCARHFSEFDQA
jgi:purine-nucleoside phosphorylase